MRVKFLVLASIAIASSSGKAADVAADNGSSAEPKLSELEEMIAHWESRTTRLGNASLDWQLQSQLRSSQFGALHDLKTAEPDADPSRQVQVRVTAEKLRWDGLCPPAIHLGAPLLPVYKDQSARWRYQEALTADIAGEQFRLPPDRPYTILADAQSETHFWDNAPNAGVAIVVFPPGAAGSLQFYESTRTGRLPLVLGMIEAMQLALHPESRLGSLRLARNRRIMNKAPEWDGGSCRVVEYDFHQGQAKGTCRLWLDPTREHLVTRSMFVSPEGKLQAQYDIEYDQDAQRDWWPARVTVFQTNSFGDCFDEVSAKRTQLSRQFPEAEDSEFWEPPEGTRIKESAEGTYLLLLSNGMKQRLMPADANGYLAGAGCSLSKAQAKNVAYHAARIEFLRWLTWPRILLLLPVIWAGWFGARSVFLFWRPTR